MGSLSIWHWLIVLAVVLVVFGGGGKISSMMGDFAKGIKSFKKHMADDEPMDEPAPRAGGHISPPPAANPADPAAVQPEKRASPEPGHTAGPEAGACVRSAG